MKVWPRAVPRAAFQQMPARPSRRAVQGLGGGKDVGGRLRCLEPRRLEEIEAVRHDLGMRLYGDTQGLAVVYRAFGGRRMEIAHVEPALGHHPGEVAQERLVLAELRKIDRDEVVARDVVLGIEQDLLAEHVEGPHFELDGSTRHLLEVAMDSLHDLEYRVSDDEQPDGLAVQHALRLHGPGGGHRAGNQAGAKSESQRLALLSHVSLLVLDAEVWNASMPGRAIPGKDAVGSQPAVPRREPGPARMFRRCPAAGANLLAAAGRAPSKRFDAVAATPPASFGPCGQPRRRVGARTRKVRRTSRVASHLEKFTEFFEYATGIGAVSGDERRHEHRPRARMPAIPGRPRFRQARRRKPSLVRNRDEPYGPPCNRTGLGGNSQYSSIRETDSLHPASRKSNGHYLDALIVNMPGERKIFTV